MLDVSPDSRQHCKLKRQSFLRFFSNLFFQGTSILAKEVEISLLHILKEVIHLEKINSSALAVVNLQYKTSTETAALIKC